MFASWIGYIVGGLVIGILARWIKPGADPMGWILTIVLGILGALAGGYLSQTMGITNTLVQWALAIVLAIVLLFIYEMIRKPKTRV
ncbi:GlsB/YeaQ/YmgE family stress response membrane protein [Lysobacter soyae]|uniref:GlsB/YeaQ/YmgE family stress response membrane protein n=1 Tax=Lysobacter soyae TaxID=2764185 RepID=A0ABX8WNB1_9GAMM|nr:GlsB/YeaQ/YmgE family stress response membrane protein [Lysobacter sp. CJ11]QYR52595.1 GlsB/YeaQ/YmgE family stress response membrane protein [Lysobacter sp. CJ11]